MTAPDRRPGAPADRPAPRQRLFISHWPEPVRALRHSNYRLFWSGALVANIGSWVRTTALGWLVLDLTGSAFLLGVVSFAQTIPVLLLSLPAGVLADRFDRRRVLFITQGLLLLLTLVLAILVATGHMTVTHLLILSILMGLAMAFNGPAWQTFITDLVRAEDLMNAIALNSAQFNLSRIIGPSLAGVLIAAVGLSLCFFINSATYMGVLLALALIRLRPAVAKPARTSMWAGIAEGLVYLRDEPTLRAIMLLTSALTIFGFPYAVLMPVMARDVLSQDAGGYGQLMAATGVGAFAGAVAVASLGRTLPRGRIILAGQMLFALSLLVFTLNRFFPLSLATLVVLGFSMVAYMTTANTVLQSATPEALRGRVMSVWTLAAFGLTPLGSLQAGALAGFFGAPVALAAGAVICILVGVGIAALTPSLRSV